MAVAWVQTVTPWSATATTATSGSFTPTSGNALVAFCYGSGTLSYSGSGTGTWTAIFQTNDSFGSPHGCGDNPTCGGGSQTITVHQTASTTVFGWAFEYSGAGSFSGTSNETDVPGTTSGAIKGTSVVVPTGSVLLALCADITGTGGSSISSPSGTNRGAATIGAVTYCVTEYAGTGAAIQPTFTDINNGGTDDYFITQILLSPAGTTPLTQCNALAVLQSHEPRAIHSLNQDTSRGIPKPLYSDVARPRVAVVQNQPVRRDVFDTTHGTPVVLLQPPKTGPPWFAPQRYPWLPADTSQSAKALLSGDFFRPAFNPPQFQVDRIRPVVDTSSTLAKTLYADSVKPAFDPPQFQIDPVRPVYDTTRGTPAEEIQPPISNPPHFTPLRFWWQPADSSQSTAKALYADALTPAFNAPTFLVDGVRPVTDTSRSSSLTVLTVQAPFTAEPGWAPIRLWWQPADTSQATPKPLYADALAAIVPPPWYQVDRSRPVTDTSQSSPVTALAAQAPFTAEPSWAPYRLWWQPADTSQATAKSLYSDALTPVVDAPQFQVDRVRPVVDTSSAEPKALYADQFTPVVNAPQHVVDRIRPVTDTSRGTAIEEIQAPLVNPPWFAPQRYPWLPADTCQSVPKALYADLYAAFFNPPQYQIDSVRPVYDTSRGSPAEEVQAPIAVAPWFAPQRFWWQPADTSVSTPKPLYADLFAARVDAPPFLIDAIRPVTDTSRSTPTVLIPVQAPFIAEPWCPPLRFFWQPLDTSQATPKAAYGDLYLAIEPPAAYQVDRVRPVVDTSQSTPVAIAAAVQPFTVLPQPGPARFWWQPADSSQSIPKTLTADQFRPVFDAPQFQIDRTRPVTDTTQSTPADLIQPPLANPPNFAPLKFWWQPADTSVSTPKAAYSDLYQPAIPAPSYQVDRVRPVTDTSHPTPGAFVPPVPVFNPPGFSPYRFWWQPADTSEGAPPTLTLVPFIYGNDVATIIPSRNISALAIATQTFESE
jgi:hypothetical protein